MRVEFTYSRNRHRADSVEWLAERYLSALEELIDHCLSPDAGGYSPSDFPLANLGGGQLERLLAKIGQTA